MNHAGKPRILVVDDEPGVREVTASLLKSQGYEVRVAEDGFDALLKLRTMPSDLVVSDLNMPRVSGFELLSVLRRRFPEISVVAMSGAYDMGANVPGGVVADAFYAKGQHDPQVLLTIVSELIRTTAAQARRLLQRVSSRIVHRR